MQPTAPTRTSAPQLVPGRLVEVATHGERSSDAVLHSTDLSGDRVDTSNDGYRAVAGRTATDDGRAAVGSDVEEPYSLCRDVHARGACRWQDGLSNRPGTRELFGPWPASIALGQLLGRNWQLWRSMDFQATLSADGSGSILQIDPTGPRWGTTRISVSTATPSIRCSGPSTRRSLSGKGWSSSRQLTRTRCEGRFAASREPDPFATSHAAASRRAAAA